MRNLFGGKIAQEPGARCPGCHGVMRGERRGYFCQACWEEVPRRLRDGVFEAVASAADAVRRGTGTHQHGEMR